MRVYADRIWVRRDVVLKGLWWAVALLASLSAVHVTETARRQAEHESRTPPPVRMPILFEGDVDPRTRESSVAPPASGDRE